MFTTRRRVTSVLKPSSSSGRWGDLINSPTYMFLSRGRGKSFSGRLRTRVSRLPGATPPFVSLFWAGALGLAPPSSASSAGRSSPCPSLPGEPAPGPSSAPDGALGPTAPPAAVSPAAVGLSPWSCPTYGSSSLRWRRPYALHRHLLLLHPHLQLLPDLLLRLLPPFCFCATG